MLFRSEGGDTVLVSANLRGIAEAGKAAEPTEQQIEEPTNDEGDEGKE